MYKIMFIISLSIFQLTNSAIRIVCTAALVPSDYQKREQLYIRSLSLFKQHGLSVYMVESCQQGPTTLDAYCDNICYTHSNIPGINNGLNEAISLHIGLKHFNFDDEDIIIKFTGKYEFRTTQFIDLVNNNLDAAAIARMWQYWDAYTVLFAMKMKHLRHFLDTLDHEAMKKGAALEHLLGPYITQLENQGEKIVYWDRVYPYLPTVCNMDK